MSGLINDKVYLLRVLLPFLLLVSFLKVEASDSIQKLVKRADSLFDIRLHQEAEPLYQSITKYYQEINSLDSFALYLDKYSTSMLMQGRYAEALTTLKPAIYLLDTCLVSPLLYANIHFRAGVCDFYLDKTDSALYHHNIALDIKELWEYNDPSSLVLSYIGLGNVYRYKTYDFDKATEFYEKALNELSHVTNDKTYSLFQCYYNLSNTLRQRQQYEKATYYAHELIKLTDSIGIDLYKRYALSNLANLYNANNQFKLAVDEYLKLIEISSDQGVDFLTTVYSNLSLCLTNMKQFDKAISYNKKALQLLEDLDTAHYRIQYASQLWGLSRGYEMKSNYAQAFNYANKFIDLTKKHFQGEIHYPILAFTYKGNLYFGRKEYEKALSLYQEALSVLSSTGGSRYSNPTLDEIINEESIYDLIHNKASALFQLFKKKSNPDLLVKSYETFLLADSVYETKKTDFFNEEDELWLQKRHIPFLQQAIECTYTLYDQSKEENYLNYLSYFMAKNKAAYLFKSIKHLKAMNSTGIPDSIIHKQQDLKLKLSLIRNEINEYTTDNVKISQLRHQMLETINRQNDLNLHIRANYENYYQIIQKKELKPISLRNLINNKSDCIIEYYKTDSIIYAIFLGKNVQEALSINIDSTLNEFVGSLQASLGTRNKTNKGEFDRFVGSSHYLYRLLFKPFEKLIENEQIEKINIIPDGEIALVPFECLITELPLSSQKLNYLDLQYLINEYRFSYNYSVPFLASNYEITSAISRPSIVSYSYDDELLPDNINHNMLNETNNINSIIPGKLYLGDQATETIFNSTVSSADIIHVAAHGFSGTQLAKPSHLRLKSDSINDGIVYDYELYNQQLKAKLTVLSSCESGSGKIKREEGIYSMARSFFYAGCPSVIMSLWKVNDASTTELITSFYKGIDSGLKLDEALFNAKIDYINGADEYTAHPANWAAFVLLGNNFHLEEPRSNSISNFQLIIALSILAIIIIAIRFRSLKM